MEQYKYLADLSREDLENEIVIPAVDDKGLRCILIKNLLNKSVIKEYKTDNLEIRLNSVLSSSGESYYFHIIKAVKDDFILRQQFDIVYEYIFKRIVSPVDDNEILSLVTSIEEYFKISPERDTYNLQIGVFGELLTILELYNDGYTDIIYKYHKNFYSKHDIEVSDKLRIEIKSTINQKRIHPFSHEQIYRTDIDVYVVSVLLEEAQEGVSLYQLFSTIKRLYKDDADSLFSIEKLILKCGVSNDNEGIRVAIENARNNIRVFNACDLPRIEMPTPPGVSNINYNVDCSTAAFTNIPTLVSIIRGY